MDLWRKNFLKQSISRARPRTFIAILSQVSGRGNNGKATKLALKFEQDKFEFVNVFSQSSYISLARSTT